MKEIRRYIVCLLVSMAVAAVAWGQQVSMTQITGLVRDSVSHEGIPYASIALVGTNEGTLATDKGGFTINTRARFSRPHSVRIRLPRASERCNCSPLLPSSSRTVREWRRLCLFRRLLPCQAHAQSRRSHLGKGASL